MTIFDRIFTEKETRTDLKGKRIHGETVKAARVFGASVIEFSCFSRILQDLIDSHPIEHHPDFTVQATYPVNILDYESITVLFSKEDQKPIYAWMNKPE